MIKKIALIMLTLGIIITTNLFAQSIDVKVHNVDTSGDYVILNVWDTPGGSPDRTYTSPPYSTIVTFENITCSQYYPVFALRSKQGNRYSNVVYEPAPFSVVHLYLSGGGGGTPEPDPGTPHNH